MNFYDGPRLSDSEVAEVYLQGTGSLRPQMYEIDGEEHPWGFMKNTAHIPPGRHFLEYRSDEIDFGDETLTGFAIFSVDLKPDYSYLVVGNWSDSDPGTVCIFEELRNDPAAIKTGLAPRAPLAGTKPLECESLEWKNWN